MAKKLVFDGSTQHTKHFLDIFTYYHHLARPSSREDHKSNNHILDALEGISEEDPCPNLDGPQVLPVVLGFDVLDEKAPRARHLKSGKQFIVIADHEFTMLQSTLSKVTTAACRSREVESMWQFLDGAISGGEKKLVEDEAVNDTIASLEASN